MVNPIVHSHKTDHWVTNPSFLERLDNIFHFVIDPCPSKFYKHPIIPYNCKDGLLEEWEGNTFINPPYSSYDEWTIKAFNQSLKYPDFYYVMLIPSRTDTHIYQDFIYKRSQLIVWLKGRQSFYRWSRKFKAIIKELNAPFPSALVIFKGNKEIDTDMITKLKVLGSVFGTNINQKQQYNDLLTFFNLA